MQLFFYSLAGVLYRLGFKGGDDDGITTLYEGRGIGLPWMQGLIYSRAAMGRLSKTKEVGSAD